MLIKDEQNVNADRKRISRFEGVFVFLLISWGALKIFTDKHGSFGPIVEQSYVADWMKFFSAWCLLISSGIALSRGIYLIRASGFKWKESFWLFWGVFPPVMAIAMGMLTLNVSQRYLEFEGERDTQKFHILLEKITQGSDASSKAENARLIAGMIFVDSGERKDYVNEAGVAVKFEPSNQDLELRGLKVETKRVMEENITKVHGSFVIWGAMFALSLGAGLIVKVRHSCAT